MNLTDEQIKIITTDLNSGEVLKINAFAGTGKTTTLVEYPKKRPEMQFLYLCFNKAMKVEAAKKFPKNVEVQTAHSFAYKHIGRLYSHKLKDNLSLWEFVKDGLEESDINKGNRYLHRVFMEYLKSPKKFNEFYEDFINRDQKSQTAEIKKNLIEITEKIFKIWKKMTDKEDLSVSMTHDGYLKLFHIKEVQLKNYDCILFDEAQDADPVMLDLVVRQESRKIIVGDQYQQIYSFRGAVNAMKSIAPTIECFLTKSFRFGNSITEDVNWVLLGFLGEQRKIRGYGPGQLEGNVAYISRTNAGLHKKALELSRKGKRIYYEGGFSSYRFSELWEVFFLYKGQKQKIENQDIKRFNSFYELENDVKDPDSDVQLSTWVGIIKDYKDDFPEVYKSIKSCIVANRLDADVILATAHKSKGQEYDKVILLPDFPEYFWRTGPYEAILDEKLNIDEHHLLYVALTRARESVDFTEAPGIKDDLKTLPFYCEIENLIPEKAADKKIFSTDKYDNPDFIYGAQDIDRWVSQIETDPAESVPIVDDEIEGPDDIESAYNYYYSDDEVIENEEIYLNLNEGELF